MAVSSNNLAVVPRPYLYYMAGRPAVPSVRFGALLAWEKRALVSLANEGSLARVNAPEPPAPGRPRTSEAAPNLAELERAAASIQPVWHEVPVPPAQPPVAPAPDTASRAELFAAFSPDATDRIGPRYVAMLAALTPPRVSRRALAVKAQASMVKARALLVKAQAFAHNRPLAAAAALSVVLLLLLVMAWPSSEDPAAVTQEAMVTAPVEAKAPKPESSARAASAPARPEAKAPPAATIPTPPAAAIPTPPAAAIPTPSAPAKRAAKPARLAPKNKPELRDKRHEKRAPRAAAVSRRPPKVAHPQKPAKSDGALGPNPYQ